MQCARVVNEYRDPAGRWELFRGVTIQSEGGVVCVVVDAAEVVEVSRAPALCAAEASAVNRSGNIDTFQPKCVGGARSKFSPVRSPRVSTAIVSSPLAAIYGAFCGHGFSPRTAR